MVDSNVILQASVQSRLFSPPPREPSLALQAPWECLTHHALNYRALSADFNCLYALYPRLLEGLNAQEPDLSIIIYLESGTESVMKT
jgi:hypothetical protein